MKNLFTLKFRFVMLCGFLFMASGVFTNANSQSFSQNGINFNGKGSLNNGTSLTFGPDGRLYVTEYTGSVKIFTIERIGPGNYSVLSMEELKGIQSIQDYNDDGTLHTSQFRETIGLAVTGTAANPVIYVSSSDFRIGGGGGGGSGDVGLDTNSGIITRYSWNGSSWDEVDIVRGLPRSEENHATNGIEFTTINGIDYLIVAQGGHTNGGGPSANFAYTTEYALSAAILSINLTMIEAMPILENNGRKYIYDLPTLDDPSRPNKNGITDSDAPGYDGIDINDPFGGNDGLNQAIIVPGGPVQIFSPGYRNAYDLVVTQSGAVYVTDNGANGGWGGFPVNEGGGNANNDYDPNEPGSTSSSGGEQINNKDHLSLVTLDMQNYTFGSFYGGHPTPVRANPNGAGLYTNPAITGTQGAVFRTQIYDPDGSRPGSTTNPSAGLPANWPPVQTANPQEGDWRGPGIDNPDGPVDAIVTSWGTNTNGIDEYTASNFEGAMKGDLIAGVNTGELRRVELNPDGTLLKLTPSFVSGLGGNALGVSCNSDSDPFPGTIWVGTLEGGLIVLEPQDFVICVGPNDTGYDPNADNDFDGYTNQDEVDNGTDPCNGGSQPNDFDKAAGAPLISDLNDPDDDNDGIPDGNDPFQLGDPLKGGSDAFDLPVINELFSSNPDLKGYMGLGMTGLQNNGDPNPNWLNWLDRRDDPNDPNPNDILGGAIGAMTMQMTSGTASGTVNTQEKGFQYGVQVDKNTGMFTVAGGLINFNAPLQLYGHPDTPDGELGFFIGDGTQINYIKFVITKTGLLALQEINDILSTPVQLDIPIAERPDAGATFFFVVEPSNGEILLEYSFDNGPRISAGTIVAQGAVLEAIQLPGKDLAVGFIGTSNASGVELEGTWDYLNVIGSGPFIVQEFQDIEHQIGVTGDTFNIDEYFDDDNGTANLTYTLVENTNQSIGVNITDNILNIIYPSSPASTTITLRATDQDQKFVEQMFSVVISEAPVVLYRVNAGGPATASIDNKIDWEEDTSENNSAFLLEPGRNVTYKSVKNAYSDEVDQSTIPVNIFETERFDWTTGEPNLTYSFPVLEAGNYEIRLYMGNGFGGTSEPGQRIFDVSIEGIVHPELDDIDLSATFGHQVGGMITKTVEVIDGSIEIVFLHVVENPLINGIEILGASGQGGGFTPINVAQIENQTNVAGEELDGSLVVQATGGDGNLSYSMTGAPAGIVIEPTNGQIGGTIDANAEIGSPYTVTITVDDSDENVNDAVTMLFQWEILSKNALLWVDKDENENYTGRHECSFVQAGDKFYLMGGRESSQTVDIYDYATNTWSSLINSAPLEFNHYQATEYQGLIWIIGAFKTNNFPSELPAEHIWIFNPVSNDWIQGPLIPSNRQRGSTGLSVYNDKFYISGGNTTGHDGGYISWFDEYDPATGIWTPLADAPRARDHFHSAVIGDKLYLAGGRLSGGVGGTFKPVIPEVDVYYFLTSTWSTLPVNLPTPRAAASVVQFDNKLLVIGGEVENENVYGVLTNDALKITEEYNPQSGSWTRIADLIYKRHGTQAIVSGNGVYTLAGSPNKGGGSQKNMEYLGTDAPVGAAGVASLVSIPSSVQVIKNISKEIPVNIVAGNVGVFIKSMELQGTEIDKFNILSGNLTNALLKANSEHIIVIEYTGSDGSETANLLINYGVAGQKVIVLEGLNNDISITTIPDQNNIIGDVLDGSLVVSATGGDGALNYDMSGAPAGVIIDPVTGGISGTISLEAASEAPYLVIVTVDDSDEVTTDAVTTTFNWTITSNQLPSVAITSPLENATFTTPVDITIDATASDTDGTVAKVEFFQGTTKLGEDLDFSNGWSYAWINVPAGTYSLTAIATDDKGAATTSAIVNITVADPVNAAPSVAITSPLENATFTTPVDITIDATASDTDGSVAKVEFFQGATKLGEDLDGSNGWSFAWNNVPTGTYSLTAIATDDIGAATTSAAVNITVSNPPSPVITSFSPTSGPVGTLVTINGNNFANATSVTFGPSSAQIISNTDTKIEALVPFVNGKLPSRVKITVTSTGGNNTSSSRFTITAGTVPVNAVPIVTINTPANNENFSAPASIGITASASDPDGSVVKVEFFNGTLKLSEDLTSPYAFNWNNVATGNYVLKAKATDDKGAVTTSKAVNISVSSSTNTAPVVDITSPANNSNFTSPASIGITASASDSDGTVVKVEFFNGVSKLGEDLTSPYSFTWNNVATGNYSLTAKATDDKGAVSTSASVNITVGAASELAAPSNLFAEWATSSQVNLYWQDNSFDEDGFVLERAYKADFTGKVDIINLSANTISYQDSNLNTNRAVYYRIKAVRSSLSSAYSNIASPIANSLANKEGVSASTKGVLENQEGILEESFVVYPNPSAGNSIIQFVLQKNSGYSLSLYNSQGAFIYLLKQGLAEAGVQYTLEFDGSQLANGLYLLRLESWNGIQTFRLLLNR